MLITNLEKKFNVMGKVLKAHMQCLQCSWEGCWQKLEKTLFSLLDICHNLIAIYFMFSPNFLLSFQIQFVNNHLLYLNGHIYNGQKKKNTDFFCLNSICTIIKKESLKKMSYLFISYFFMTSEICLFNTYIIIHLAQ